MPDSSNKKMSIADIDRIEAAADKVAAKPGASPNPETAKPEAVADGKPPAMPPASLPEPSFFVEGPMTVEQKKLDFFLSPHTIPFKQAVESGELLGVIIISILSADTMKVSEIIAKRGCGLEDKEVDRRAKLFAFLAGQELKALANKWGQMVKNLFQL